MAFDKKTYQRNYMRAIRANGSKSNESNENVVSMPRRRYAFDEIIDRAARLRALKTQRIPLSAPQPPPGVVPKGKDNMLAMDGAVQDQMTWANAQFAGNTFAAVAHEGLLFLGYAYLAELAQRAEYRIPTETIATEMTRKWIKFKSTVDKKAKHEREEKEAEAEAEEAEAEAPELAPGEEPAEEPAEAPEEPEGEPDEDEGAEDEAPLLVDPDAMRRDAEGIEEEEPDGPELDNPEESVEEKDEDEKTERIKELEDEFTRLQVQERFKEIAMHDGFYGRAHLFLDFSEGDEEIDELHGEMASDIGDGRNEASRNKVQRGGLKRIKTIEPVWTYPTTYNAINPLRDDWYNPTVWYVMGREIHVSRLLTFIGRPVPDLLKPSYMFGGLSLSQLVKPYVDLWLNTRQNIGQLIQAFSVMVLKTNLSATLQTGGEEMFSRAAMFNMSRDNAGLMMLDKNTEEFENVSAPLSGLDHLQAQAQEHMMSVVRIPAVKFTGIQPSGLNASSEGEIRTFYDTIEAYQESFFRPNLTKLMHFVMLSLWGEVDEDITFDFEPLWALTRKEEAEVRKIEAETADILINGCAALRPEEVREAIAADPDTPYAGIDVEDVPDPPQLQQEGLAQPGKVNIKGTSGFGGGPGGKAGGGGGSPFGGGGGDDANPFGRDAFEWLETDHPRDDDGKFTSGGGGGGGSKVSSFKEKQKFQMPQFGLFSPPQAAHSGSTFVEKKPKPPLDVSKLKKVGGQMGSNPGGVYEDDDGTKFYIKKGRSKAHVREELTAAALYNLAGARTLRYQPVEGGDHIATEMAKLDKDNANKLSPEEVTRAREDFAVHAWLANWDATGLGGDNIGTIHGKPVSLDLGGALGYRAQGAPKGAAFGTKVGELDTLRDPKMNKDAAKVFAGMTPAELRQSMRYVTEIPDKAIRDTVEKSGGDKALADKLIARKNDIAERMKTIGAEGDPKKATSTVIFGTGSALPVKTLNGVAFKPWDPPEDWANVDGQADIQEPELPETKKGQSSGLVIREADGRVWIMRPKGGFGGYEGTFPKGRLEKEGGLSLQANAIKEAWEETGLKARVTGYAGDFEGDTTSTRYYFAERDGGDPSSPPGGETDGVVLSPPEKLSGFLNRSRDREIARGLAGDAAFNESDHPRDPDGKFASGGGGSKSAKSSMSTSEASELGEVAIKSKAKGGSHYRAMIKEIMDKVPKGWPMHAKLKEKLIESWQITYQSMVKKGNAEVADKIAQKIEKLGGKVGAEFQKLTPGPKTGPMAPKPGPTMVEQVLSQLGVPTPEQKKKEQIEAAVKAAEAEKQKPPEPPPQQKFPPPTEAELQKAKKSVALQVQYVPGGGDAPPAVAQALVNTFNTKWANKDFSNDPAKLAEKVNDFKQLAANMQKHAQAGAAEKAKAAAEAQVLLEKQKAEQAAIKAKQQAEAKAAAAKANAEKKAKLAGVMQELGITEQEADGFLALASMMGGDPATLAANFKAYENKAKAFGYPISGFQAAIISNYSDGGYSGVNQALRSLTWTESQHVYTKLMSKALQAMPTFTGTATRGASLTPEQISRYKVGNIVPEMGFTSASAGGPGFGGNVKFKITGIGKRGAHIKKLSQHPSEDEVVFSARTLFKVTKVEGSTIHMEEMED